MKLRLITILFLTFVSLSFGQTPPASPSPTQSAENDDQLIKVKTLLINIPVIASDKDGRYISGLTKDDFLIIEDSEKQPIAFFADDQSPMNVAILIDASGSTRSFIRDIQEAARDFVKVLRDKDQGLIAGFTEETYIFSEFTSDHKQLQNAIDKISILPHGGSDMQDAIYQLVTKRFTSVKGRKAIIVLTDGLVGGHISNKQLLSVLAESDVLVYPVLFKETVRVGSMGIRKDQMQFMNSLATATGGRLYKRNLDNFKKVFQAIADELKTQYLLGFYPQNLDDGKDHKIGVGVNSKDIVIRTKGVIQLKPVN